MANDLFGGLGNLDSLVGSVLVGIAKSIVSTDTPDGKLLNAQSDLPICKNRNRAYCWKSANRRINRIHPHRANTFLYRHRIEV
jgi:hypothetical protein